MKIGHFTPSYTPICAGQTAQICREQETLCERLGYQYQWWSEEQSDIVAIRNRAVRDAMEMGLDALVFQDSDIFSKSKIGVIAPLLSTAAETGATLVAAVVGLRREPHCANVEPYRPGEAYEAEKAGTGIMLIDLHRLQKLEHKGPWFARKYNEDGSQIEIGEDIWFCREVRNAGGKLWVDGRIPTTHKKYDLKSLDYPGAAAVRGKTQASYPTAQQGAQ